MTCRRFVALAGPRSSDNPLPIRLEDEEEEEEEEDDDDDLDDDSGDEEDDEEDGDEDGDEEEPETWQVRGILALAAYTALTR